MKYSKPIYIAAIVLCLSGVGIWILTHTYNFLGQQRPHDLGVHAPRVSVSDSSSSTIHSNDTGSDEGVATSSSTTATTTPHKGITMKEYAYGTAPLEKLSVSYEGSPKQSPIIVMVHGGSWVYGDKTEKNTYQNKAAYWLPKGYLFVSVNYPMIPSGTMPDKQADSVAAALAYVQNHAAAWGGDPSRMVVMGFSAGGQLVSLVSAKRTSYPTLQPWSGTVLLDSAVYDIPTTMKLVASMGGGAEQTFTKAFGTDPVYWEQNSPYQQLTTASEPQLVICSSKRMAAVCSQAKTYVEKIQTLHGTATLVPIALIHDDINAKLGLSSDYTKVVDSFITEIVK